ncbi:type IV pilus modification protein PilV [Diaphorobacter sp. HDW4B]|uniref:type IV pilus modification protein PilV n=1 Tax=Diaphorobacter sp. HDW4B TaxID=2714925 RepID=UPI00140A9651|nr:type IV pilus modification protein PilV [Diaphorobacter sp. HDW4B]QIL72037.1 type IV pilus modification protein PilV [Diaphorobacter sp. HDW4B]
MRNIQLRAGHIRTQMRGVTLVEMMIAILVLAVGLLGMAGLQAATSKYKINTWARASTATLLSDLTEKIRINPFMAGPGFTDPLLADQPSTLSKFVVADDWSKQQADALSVSTNCAANACTESERAAYDLVIWRQNVRALLPQGAAMIEGGRATGVLLTLMWFDKEQAAATASSDPLARKLEKAPICSSNTPVGMAEQSCCPEKAAAPAGVKCARFRFVP